MANKKWYSYFVVTGEAERAPGAPATADAAPRRVTDIVPDLGPEPVMEPPAQAPVDFLAVYESAKIAAPAHGYTVLKVADMLESEHIKALPADVKRKSLLVALDAAGVKVDEIVEDAVRRDRALDVYERVLERNLDGLRAQVATENKQIEDEIARRLAELRARVDANRQNVEQAEREFHGWRARKRDEEATIARAVSYFVSENPITTASVSGEDKGDRDGR